MYFFGHIGVTLFLATLFSLSWVFAIIGVLLPDVVDKSLFFIGLTPCPRFFAHSIFFGPIVGLITYLITRRKDYSIAIVFGSYLHLLEDVYGFMVPWLYPLVQYNFISVCPSAFKIVYTPYNIVTDIIGIALILIVLKFRTRLMKIGRKLFKFQI